MIQLMTRVKKLIQLSMSSMGSDSDIIPDPDIIPSGQR